MISFDNLADLEEVNIDEFINEFCKVVPGMENHRRKITAYFSGNLGKGCYGIFSTDTSSPIKRGRIAIDKTAIVVARDLYGIDRARSFMRETILHELAHAYLYFEGMPFGHNSMFKMIMKRLGINQESRFCQSFEVAEAAKIRDEKQKLLRGNRH
jgi:hypothetical protein